MKRKMGRKTALPVLCAALLLTGVLSAAPSYARYENGAVWSAVYAPEQAQVTADMLAAGGQTVLLSDWRMDQTAPRKELITLKTTSGTGTGTIRCRVDQQDYLQATQTINRVLQKLPVGDGKGTQP